MQRPQTIQIFLPDGSPTSIREAEITKGLVKAVLFPRNKLAEVSKREFVNYTGVYFLFGTKEDIAKPIVYIGEGECCYDRILSHNRNKDFWTHCIVLTTKTNEYTKTDGKYLEHHCIAVAKQVGRYELDNDTGSRKTSITESREYDLLDNFEAAKILLATLGYPLFEEKRKAESENEVFTCQGKETFAQGELVDDGYVVFKGGKCLLEETLRAPGWVKSLRKKLVDQSVLKEEDNYLVFQEDYIFSSPSAAASTVKGRTSNGWTSWRSKEGKTLDQVKRI
ncbi:GIY-YIG nuclease family protein [Salinimicrobium sp. 3283s]|uniref:GIY-YIG nuclease family protein n=1 Tax=Salinimicrobium sp. 3283s TaxID=3114359 RepID=UPI0031E5DF54